MPNIESITDKRARAHELAIRINLGVNIGVNKSVLWVLGKPQHIYFWWNEENKILAISAAEPTNMSVQLPNRVYFERTGCRLGLHNLRKAIKILSGWEDKSIHYLVGDFIPELNIVTFKLSEAIDTAIHAEERSVI
jgi:hypothetical protein